MNVSLCNLCVLCVSVVMLLRFTTGDTENTEVAQRSVATHKKPTAYSSAVV